MARRQVSIFINGKKVAKEIGLLTAEKRKLQRALNKKIIGGVEVPQKFMGGFTEVRGSVLFPKTDVLPENRTHCKLEDFGKMVNLNT